MKIGFIGCGNMATAMLKGILKSGEVKAADMIASAKSDKTRKKIEQELRIQKADTNAQVVDFADVVFLAVKPQFLEGVLNEIKDCVLPETLVQNHNDQQHPKSDWRPVSVLLYKIRSSIKHLRSFEFHGNPGIHHIAEQSLLITVKYFICHAKIKSISDWNSFVHQADCIQESTKIHCF